MRDLRDAFRALVRSKGFTVIAVLSLALALGLNTTVYAVLDAFVHPQVPYRNPERIVRFTVFPNSWGYRVLRPGELDTFLRERARFVTELQEWRVARNVVETPSGLENLVVADVAGNFFRVLEVVPLRGRLFAVAGENDVAVVSHRTWAGLLNRGPIGDSISVLIDGRAHSVIGVLPRGMNHPEGADVWRPLPPNSPGAHTGQADITRLPSLIGRLVDGVSLADAQRQVASLAREFQGRFPGTNATFEGWARTLEPPPRTLTRSHGALAASAALILLIACANLANLMLARGVARRGELAVRMAIGASRGALVRQLTTEAAVLAVAGGILGMALAGWGVGIAAGGIPPATFITLSEIQLSWRVVAFGFLATAVTVLLVGLFPALRTSDLNVADPLKEGAASITGRARGRYSVLAITQVALALTILMSAGVLIRSAAAFAGSGVGYPLDNLYRLYVGRAPDDQSGPVFHALVERVRTVPGVRFATNERSTALYAAVSDRESDPVTAVRSAYFRTSPDYFRTMGIPIVQGRDFGPGDNEVAIVNLTAATALWPGESPIGRRVQLEPGAWKQVVGVCRNVGDPEEYPQPRIYVASAVDTARVGPILFRTDGTGPQVALDVARVVQATVGPGVSSRMGPVGAEFELDLSAKQFLAGLFVLLGASGLGLTAVGLYGVLAFAVSRRMREFGIRIALGAESHQLLRMVLHDGAVMFLAGTAIGAFSAMAAAQLVDTLLYRVGFTDVWSLIAAEALLCGVALLACLGPARHAMRANPLEIIRGT